MLEQTFHGPGLNYIGLVDPTCSVPTRGFNKFNSVHSAVDKFGQILYLSLVVFFHKTIMLLDALRVIRCACV